MWIQTVINRLYRNVTLLYDFYAAFCCKKIQLRERLLNRSSDDVWIDSINSFLTNSYHGIFGLYFGYTWKREIKLPKDVNVAFISHFEWLKIAVLELKLQFRANGVCNQGKQFENDVIGTIKRNFSFREIFIMSLRCAWLMPLFWIYLLQNAHKTDTES